MQKRLRASLSASHVRTRDRPIIAHRNGTRSAGSRALQMISRGGLLSTGVTGKMLGTIGSFLLRCTCTLQSMLNPYTYTRPHNPPSSIDLSSLRVKLHSCFRTRYASVDSMLTTLPAFSQRWLSLSTCSRRLTTHTVSTRSYSPQCWRAEYFPSLPASHWSLSESLVL